MQTFLIEKLDGSYQQIQPQGGTRFVVRHHLEGRAPSAGTHTPKSILGIIPVNQMGEFVDWLEQVRDATPPREILYAIGAYAQGKFEEAVASLGQALDYAQAAKLASDTLSEVHLTTAWAG